MKKLTIFFLIFVSSQLFSRQLTHTEYVNVISSTPTYEEVVIQRPYNECHHQVSHISYHSGSYDGDAYREAGDSASVVGGVIGGILGHQIGRGDGKVVATIGGTILGTLIGRRESSYHRNNIVTSYQNPKICTTNYEQSVKRRFTGYKNIAYYHGERIVKYSNKILSQIPIYVTISY